MIYVRKCVLCGNEISGKSYSITEPKKNSTYISTDKDLIGKQICEDEDNISSGSIGFYEKDGEIIVYKENTSSVFFFRHGIVANFFLKRLINEDDLKKVCDIAKNNVLFESKKRIGKLVKVLKTPDRKPITVNYDFIENLETFIKKWENPAYVVITETSYAKNGVIEIYINKENENEFLSFVNKYKKEIPYFEIVK